MEPLIGLLYLLLICAVPLGLVLLVCASCLPDYEKVPKKTESYHTAQSIAGTRGVPKYYTPVRQSSECSCPCKHEKSFWDMSGVSSATFCLYD